MNQSHKLVENHDHDVAIAAAKFRKQLNPNERLTLATAAMLSLDPDSRDALINTAERNRRADAAFRRAARTSGRVR